MHDVKNCHLPCFAFAEVVMHCHCHAIVCFSGRHEIDDDALSALSSSDSEVALFHFSFSFIGGEREREEKATIHAVRRDGLRQEEKSPVFFKVCMALYWFSFGIYIYIIIILIIFFNFNFQAIAFSIIIFSFIIFLFFNTHACYAFSVCV